MIKNHESDIDQRPARRFTIGVLVDRLDERYQSGVLDGIIEEAKEQGANLLCFMGRALNAQGPMASNNLLYDLIDVENVDGLIFMGGSLFNLVSDQEVQQFLERYRSFPMASIGRELAGVVNVEADNASGICEAVEHLVQVHGLRRIAFIRGPEKSEEAEIRYHAYQEELAAYGIPFDPQLVAEGDFSIGSGHKAVALFLDERKLDIQAIVAANDNMARGVLEALRERGVQVPDKVAVIGFDDQNIARAFTPSLTTVRQPLFTLGREAVRLVMAQLEGKAVTELVNIPARLVRRRSCGCFNDQVLNGYLDTVAWSDQPFAQVWPTRYPQVLDALIEAGKPLAGLFSSDQIKALLDVFVAEITGKHSNAFLAALDRLIGNTVLAGQNTDIWQDILSAWRLHLLPLLNTPQLRLNAETLWQQARILVGEAGQRNHILRRAEAEQRILRFGEVVQQLGSIYTMDDLANAVASHVPRMGIKYGYVSLYQDAEHPTQAARYVLGYDEQGRVRVDEEQSVFPSRRLLPEELLRGRSQFMMVVLALFDQWGQIGFALFDLNAPEREVYEALRNQLTSSLRSLLFGRRFQQLYNDMEKRSSRLQTIAEVSQATLSILNSEELIRRSVELIRDRFDYYYVGLFMVDETGEWSGEKGRWAVLRAGTGEAGREMLARGHKLEIGGDSMIGQCIALGRARIALDIGVEAHRFDNPLLPNTRSEMALPLIARGRTIGALTIQSALEAAFSEADITVLQLLADQLAIALQTAILLEQAQLQAERERLVRTIAERVYRATDREAILRVTLEELGQLLGASRAIVQLGMHEQQLVER